jgi:hypothetical protein
VSAALQSTEHHHLGVDRKHAEGIGHGHTVMAVANEMPVAKPEDGDRRE